MLNSEVFPYDAIDVILAIHQRKAAAMGGLSASVNTCYFPSQISTMSQEEK